MSKYLLYFSSLFFFFSASSQNFSLDKSFGQNGITTSGYVDAFSSVAQQTDGKVVAAAANSFTIVRFNSDGTPDNTFGTNGQATVSFSSVPWPYNVGNLPASSPAFADIYSIAVNKDGKIAAAGRVYYNGGWFSGSGYVVAIFSADGALINVDGPILNINFTGDIYTSDLRASSVTAQSDGKFVVVGEEQRIYGLGDVLGTEYIISKYSADGPLEKSTRTLVPRSIRNYFGALYAYTITTQDNGQIIVVGQGGNPDEGFDPTNRILLRYNSDLTLDNTFGTGGIKYTSFMTIPSNVITLQPNYVSDHSIAVQHDGKIIAAGSNNGGLAVARFNPDGILDNSFGVGGIAFIGLSSQTASVSIQNDGKILVTGAENYNFGLARLNPDGTLDNSFENGGKISITVNTKIINTAITPNRAYAAGSSQGIGAIAAFAVNNICTPPTFLNDRTIVLDASCTGRDGNISIIPTSGKTPFMYSINGGATYVNGPASGYTFQGLAAGTYQLRLKDAGGCESEIVNREVRKLYGGPRFLNDGSIVLDASCNGNDGNISIIPTCGAAPFKYSIDGGVSYVTGPATGYTFQGLDSGTYQLRLKDFYGTESSIVTREVRPNMYGPCALPGITNPGVKATHAKEAVTVRAYPNPSKGRFQVQLGNFSSPRVQLQVVDARGSVLQSKSINTEQTNTVEVDLTGKAKGLYLIRVVSDKEVRTTKVNVQ